MQFVWGTGVMTSSNILILNSLTFLSCLLTHPVLIVRRERRKKKPQKQQKQQGRNLQVVVARILRSAAQHFRKKKKQRTFRKKVFELHPRLLKTKNLQINHKTSWLVPFHPSQIPLLALVVHSEKKTP